MSEATDMLIEVTAAYKNALTGKSTQLNGKRWELQDIDKLRDEMLFWRGEVKKEEAALAASTGSGRSGVGPMRTIV